MFEKKNDIKINLNCLRTNNEFFLCLGTNKALSLREFDECETHLVLILFFMHILDLNVQFNAKSWNLHPNLCFVGVKSKRRKKIARKASELAKAGSTECHENLQFCRDKTKGN